jgi:RNA polymerase sigma-70 factor (ECF subfamily)
MNCLNAAMDAHAPELRGWARRRLPDDAAADDLVQEVLLRALRQGPGFCAVRNPRAWMFTVARHLLADQMRVAVATVELPDDLVAPPEESPVVDGLTACLPRVLGELAPEDRDVLLACDLQGMRQADYARTRGLGLSAAKSRLQRARLRLKSHMAKVCQVRLDDQGRVEDFVPRPPAVSQAAPMPDQTPPASSGVL